MGDTVALAAAKAPEDEDRDPPARSAKASVTADQTARGDPPTPETLMEKNHSAGHDTKAEVSRSLENEYIDDGDDHDDDESPRVNGGHPHHNGSVSEDASGEHDAPGTGPENGASVTTRDDASSSTENDESPPNNASGAENDASPGKSGTPIANGAPSPTPSTTSRENSGPDLGNDLSASTENGTPLGSDSVVSSESTSFGNGFTESSPPREVNGVNAVAAAAAPAPPTPAPDVRRSSKDQVPAGAGSKPSPRSSVEVALPPSVAKATVSQSTRTLIRCLMSDRHTWSGPQAITD